MDWVLYLCLLAVQLLGLALALFQMPGLWLMLGATAVYAWVTANRGYVSITGLCILLGLALVSEVLELAAGGAGAKRAGASKLAVLAAMGGGIIGAIVGSIFIPVPIFGTIAGACIGSFVAALLVELWRFGDVGHSLRVGYGAAKGRFLGIVAKLTIGGIMLLATMVIALPIHPKYPGLLPTSPIVVPMPGVPATAPSIPTTSATLPT